MKRSLVSDLKSLPHGNVSVRKMRRFYESATNPQEPYTFYFPVLEPRPRLQSEYAWRKGRDQAKLAWSLFLNDFASVGQGHDIVKAGNAYTLPRQSVSALVDGSLEIDKQGAGIRIKIRPVVTPIERSEHIVYTRHLLAIIDWWSQGILWSNT